MRRFFVILLLLTAIAVEVWRNLPPEMRKLPGDWVLFPDGAPGSTGSKARDSIMNVARSQIGIRERTGRNDGEVEKYIASVGLDSKAGHPYCGAFVYWCSHEAEVEGYPKSAWSPDFVKNPTWKRGKGDPPEAGDTFGIWFSSKDRVAHTGLVEGMRKNLLVTVEGNTSGSAAAGSAGDREGQGVFRKYRHLRTVYAVRDWIGQ